jgi:hypothetical protein
MPGLRYVASLPDHERPREIDHRRAILIDAGGSSLCTMPTFGRDFDSRVSRTSLRE